MFIFIDYTLLSREKFQYLINNRVYLLRKKGCQEIYFKKSKWLEFIHCSKIFVRFPLCARHNEE